MNALDHAGTTFRLGLCRPNLTSSMTANGQIHRVSFEVSKEASDELARTKDFKRLILEAELRMVNHDNQLAGGFQSNLAAMMCADPYFHMFIEHRGLIKGTAIPMSKRFQEAKGDTVKKKWTDYARAWMCHGCGIQSRKELDHSTVALEQFSKLKKMFISYCEKNQFNCVYLGIS